MSSIPLERSTHGSAQFKSIQHYPRFYSHQYLPLFHGIFLLLFFRLHFQYKFNLNQY
jgi:hypothetical protein